MTTSELLEAAMLISFSLSWFWSISKMLTTRTAAGKSIVFVVSICLGYTLGIASKVIAWQQTEQLSPLFWIYIWNLMVIALDAVLVMNYARRDSVESHEELALSDSEDCGYRRLSTLREYLPSQEG